VIIKFYQILWEKWLSGTLNWSEFEPWGFEESPIQIEEKWNDNQDWIFQDSNRFYHPLFGLGNVESPIALIAAGPAHNDGWIWEEYSEEPHREAINGPPQDTSEGMPTWFGKEGYLTEFKLQKQV